MSLWTPAKLTNMYHWYTTSGLTGANFSSVNNLLDLSGNGRTLTPVATSPQLRNDSGSLLNGLPVIEFIDAVRGLRHDNLTELNVSGLFVICVYRSLQAKSNARVVDISGRINHTAQTVGFSEGAVLLESAATAWKVAQAIRPTIIATRYLLLSGDIQHNGSSPFPVTSPIWNVTSQFSLVGLFAELLVTAVQSTDVRQLIEGYIHWKWGLQSLLANDHPYKNAAPLDAQTRRRRYSGSYGL